MKAAAIDQENTKANEDILDVSFAGELTTEQLQNWLTELSRFQLQALWNAAQKEIFDTTPPDDLSVMSIRESAEYSAEHWEDWKLVVDVELTRKYFCLREIDSDLASAIHSSLFTQWEMTHDTAEIRVALQILAAFIYAYPGFSKNVGPRVSEHAHHLWLEADPTYRQQYELDRVAQSNLDGGVSS